MSFMVLFVVLYLTCVEIYFEALFEIYSAEEFSICAVDPSRFVKVLSALAAIRLNGIHTEDLDKLLPPDDMDPTLTIMLMFTLTSKIADNIPAAINHELVCSVGCELLPTLYGVLGINGPEGMCIYRKLVQESPSIVGGADEEA
ncbi:hypothetical protein C8F04DRAFT_1192743 [Mycena alexandri]|uniref:Uncharacterized protein n=1 Tax=Mycena alexandri TaxID=1745969 RepID=A0AAD6WR73_9AGAR|nr:hypothetical protein C8F04DRAFT_1192743 [Mycena alexandri]